MAEVSFTGWLKGCSDGFKSLQQMEFCLWGHVSVAQRAWMTPCGQGPPSSLNDFFKKDKKKKIKADVLNKPGSYEASNLNSIGEKPAEHS